MKYFLGVDAGGTSTRFVIFNHEGELLDVLKLESIHFMKVDDATMKERLMEARIYFGERYDLEETFVAMGLGGYGQNLEIRQRIENVVYSVFPNAYLTNDAKFAMISALNMQDGVFVISGTGSIAFRSKDTIESRRGGYGYLVGDEGSGFWIGKKLLERFTQEADGRIPKTECYSVLMKELNLSTPYDIVPLASSQDTDYRTWVASLAGLLSNVESVQDIYAKAGRELSRLANSFNIKEQTNIAFGGSVLVHQETVRKELIKNLDPLYNILEFEHEIEYSAYLIHNSL
ncbi:N-acetylglucosamine kinase [Erysipelothrix urinaevulpis]|uniref:N-acetylglucosamine kinase n=1 Tax=Erysipelothrix urinaevulpis TaxID=2683717 RepID=UPI001359F198|nr:BadF/BadG/BcrA/BcrD ATPase family protein [Erysipelothrix urinaevulpis]